MNRDVITVTLLTLNLAVAAASAQTAGSDNTTIALNGNQTATLPVRAHETRTVSGLEPFTHFALIPTDSDQGMIRFERAKIVRVPTSSTNTINPTYCEELAFRDPGGSMYCPYTKMGLPAKAIEVTYSYIGQPLASDEHADRNSTFQVYFRPEELSPQVLQVLAESKRKRADLAEFFTMTVLREPVRRSVIDEANSHFCDGNCVDGVWTPSDGKCKDEIYMKTVISQPDYITVRVDPVSAMTASVSAERVGRLPARGK